MNIDIKPKIHIGIGVALHEYVKFDTMVSLFNLWAKMIQERITVEFLWSKGSLINEARQGMVDKVLECGMSHLFFIDSDMRFPADGLLRLLRHDLDVVSGIYFAKQPGYTPVAAHRNKEGAYIRLTEWPHDRLFEVDGVGAGFLLIKRKVLEKLQWPHFAEGLQPKTKTRIGEDYYFCRKAQLDGFKIHVDPTLDLRHIGDYEYSEKDFVRFAKLMKMHEEQKALNDNRPVRSETAEPATV